MNEPVVIYNSLSRKKEVFKPINSPYVGLYVCGPTVYSNVHIGNVRSFVVFDIVYRYLSFLGYKVRYVRNITDVGHLVDDADEGEDKIAKRARLENLEPMEVVQKYVNDFHNIMQKINNLPPSIEPTATGHLIEQIEMIQQIINNGFAYEVNGSVYFDVNKYNDSKKSYGQLSGRVLEDLLTNTRDLDGQDDKKSSLDFALWKKAENGHIMKWPSPWGIGFPGWHLECSAMSTKYLGNNFDIHGGGMDLKFPHHECEIAQSVASCDTPPVNYWMHGNMLTLNGEKMSKSKGNAFTPEELFQGTSEFFSKPYTPNVVRFFMLQSHYSSTLDISDNALLGAEKGFERLMDAFFKIGELSPSKTSSFDVAVVERDCYNAMNDDFNTPILISVLFGAAKKINGVVGGSETLTKEDIEQLVIIFHKFFVEVLGIKPETKNTEGDKNEVLDKLMDVVVSWRTKAKEEKDYQRADQIRNDLNEINISIKDSPEGASWSLD